MITKKLKIKLAFTTFLAFVSSLSLVVSPYFLGLAIDAMVGKDEVDMAVVVANLLLALTTYALNFVLTWIVALVSNGIAVDTVYEIRMRLKEKMTHLPLSYLDTHSLGDLQALFANDGELVIDGLNQFINQALSGIFVIVISLLFMLRINVFMTIVTVALVPVMFLSAQFIAKRSLKLQRKQQALSGSLSGIASEVINNNNLIMAYNHQDSVIASFDTVNYELSRVAEKAVFIAALPNPTTRVVNNIGYMLIGLTGAYAVKHFGLTVGFLTSFVSYSNMFSKPFNELSAIVSQITAAKAGYDRIQTILNVADERDSDHEEALQGDTIEFDNVDFGYVAHKPIITNLNLSIKPKSKIAIVGPTGAGKSTLINLLMRFYDINDGSIKIDAKDTQWMSKASVRNVMAIVLQDPWLFNGTIRDNIRYGRPDASEEMVHQAAVQAGCHDYIMSLDKGYDSMVELGSRNISLGQRQMITIARALLVDAPIIILDEATSSLDVVSEQAIQQVFTKIMKDKTSFFIAHRLNTVIDSDVILVMKDGKLIEQGTHDVLLENKGFYYDLFTSQASNTENS